VRQAQSAGPRSDDEYTHHNPLLSVLVGKIFS
jgi:hypothetical protein